MLGQQGGGPVHLVSRPMSCLKLNAATSHNHSHETLGNPRVRNCIAIWTPIAVVIRVVHEGVLMELRSLSAIRMIGFENR